MPTNPLRPLIYAFALSCFCSTAIGFQFAAEPILRDAKRTLKTTSPELLEQKRKETQSLCQSSLDQLSNSAIGYVLARDLHLPELVEQLRSETPDYALVSEYEQKLRRIVPGPDQSILDQLKSRVSELRRLATATDSSIHRADACIDRLFELHTHPGIANLSEQEREEIATCFSALHDTNLSPEVLSTIQQRLSHPNLIVRLRKSLVENEKIAPFRVPVHLETTADRSHIKVDGSLLFNTKARLPESTTRIPVLIDVAGGGNIDAFITRPSLQIGICMHLNASGTQGFDINPKDVARGDPKINAQLNSQLRFIEIDGVFGRSHLVRNMLSRLGQRKLSEQDPIISRQAEAGASEKAAETGSRLVNKINSLLMENLWKRLESVDFSPSISLSSDRTYVNSRALYAMPTQLGALTSPPGINTVSDFSDDWCVSIHESAIGNCLEYLRGKSIDEATMRGIWQVQLKLTREEWESPKAAIVPARITLDPQKSCQFHFGHHVAEFVLHLQAGQRGDGPAIDPPTTYPPCSVRFRYRLNPRKSALQITRDDFEFSENLSATEQESWAVLLDGFFPPEVSPIPRFRPSLWSQFVSLQHIESQNGWLNIELHSHGSPAVAFPATHSGGEPTR